MFTTLLSNVFGISQPLRELFTIAAPCLYLFGVRVCLGGYSQLLRFLSPLFGCRGLASLGRVALLLKSLGGQR